jgi:hypothetical protein
MNTNPENSIKLVLEAIPKIVHVLTPLSSEERQRAISAAMLLFGETAPTPSASLKTLKSEEHPPDEGGISGKGLLWMKKNALTREQLEHVFSIDSDSIDVITSNLPGKSKRQQTVQAYVLCGLKSFLRTGETSFSDKEGRELCDKKVGCYDSPNHSNYMKAFGNFLSGSKETGWKLTNPGLSEAAQIVKQLMSTATA